MYKKEEHSLRFSAGLWLHKARAPLFLGLALWLIIITDKHGLSWKYAHWFFNYEYGFIRRGFIGELIRWAPFDPSFNIFITVSAVSLMLVAVLFFVLIKDMPDRDFFAFGAAFLFMPILFRNYVVDFGRYDQIAIMFVFLQIYFLRDTRISAVLLCLSPLLLFIHEAMAFWAFPTILTIAFFEYRKVLYMVAPALAASVAVLVVWGDLDVGVRTYYEYISELAAPREMHWAVVFSLKTEIGDVFGKYIPYFWDVFASPRGFSAAFFVFAFIASLFCVRDKSLVCFGIAALMSVCVLFFLGTDYWRWVSLLATSVLFTLLYAYKRGVLSRLPQLAVYLMILGLIGIFFEPVGIYPETLGDVFVDSNRSQFFGPDGD